MKTASAQKLDIDIGKAGSVSALLDRPPKARACVVFAHGAGAGMTHPFMETVASGLGERGLATLPWTAADRGRQILWRTHDLASASRCAITRRVWTGVPGLPAASGGQA